MIIFKSINKLNKYVNFNQNIGFVPTMGALHNGHISLIKKSKKSCDKTIVSIYVNRKQFNNLKDYRNYPRNINKDLKILIDNKVDYILLPKKGELFAKNNNERIKYTKIKKILCAKFRPGHFNGVLNVINGYFKLIKPKKIFLGEKDYQQFFLIKDFLKKNYSTNVIMCKTQRYNGTYALSSRNNLLLKRDLKKLSEVSKIIKEYYLLIKKDFKNIKNIMKVKKKIGDLDVKIEYFEIRNKNNLSKIANKVNFKIFICYYYKKIRFIDNF